LGEYQASYKKLTGIRKELKTLRELENESARRMELLSFQVQEIEAAQLKEGEEGELDQERSRLANAENLSVSAQQALALLDEGQPDTSSAVDLIGQASQLLASLARIDASQQELASQVEAVNAQLTEVNRDLRGYLDGIEFNPRRLEQVENRLELIHQMKRKYGGSVEAAIEYGINTRVQLENIANAGERIAELETAETAALQEAKTLGLKLSEKRKAAAVMLASAVESELADLSMPGARFSVSFDQDAHNESGKEHFNESGVDQVEFLIAPNPGEGLKPLVKIASGGETSRLMLALKNVLAGVDFVPTLVFDEIDQGIGGRVGFIVGEKLWHLGVHHQVMCVTHLSQLAAFGDQHFRVRKQIVNDRTLTEAEELDDTARIVELAQMTGSMSESNLSAAQEMLSKAHERQKQLEG
jgi:DNA repair protein RecN (Recombination protein N)